MVQRQLDGRDVNDPLVLAAMGKVERERFVPGEYRAEAYNDGPLPIGYEQTISQPYIVGLMTQALGLQGGEHILEIGTGSGYAAAVLGEIAESVVTMEYVLPLADRARKLLKKLGYQNITVISGDGTMGYPQSAPYDGIIVTAGGPDVPESLLNQLTDGGRLVIPVGSSKSFQQLVRVTKHRNGEFAREVLCDVRFVPLIGEQGWPQGGREE